MVGVWWVSPQRVRRPSHIPLTGTLPERGLRSGRTLSSLPFRVRVPGTRTPAPPFWYFRSKRVSIPSLVTIRTRDPRLGGPVPTPRATRCKTETANQLDQERVEMKSTYLPHTTATYLLLLSRTVPRAIRPRLPVMRSTTQPDDPGPSTYPCSVSLGSVEYHGHTRLDLHDPLLDLDPTHPPVCSLSRPLPPGCSAPLPLHLFV